MELILKNLQKKIKINKNFIFTFLKKLCSQLNFYNESEICVVFVNHKIMHKFNKLYLNHNYTTDVLSFRLGYRKIKKQISIVGDIMINVEYAQDKAPIYKNTFLREVCLYIIHGILHLVGYDDKNEADKRKMQCLQIRLLNKLLPR